MELPKVIIRENFNEYLSGKEVKAETIKNPALSVQPGAHVLAFKDAIAATTDVTVPKTQQSHYIGIEGIVVDIEHTNQKPQNHIQLRVRKL